MLPQVSHALRPLLLVLVGFSLAVLPVATATSGLAADLAQARSAFYRGEYEDCIALTRGEVDKGIWNDVWSRQLIECLLVTGRYDEACQVYEQVAERFSNSIPLRVLAARAYRFAGRSEQGDRLLNQIPELLQSAPWRFSDRDNLLAIGRYLLSLGEDARAVLDAFYDRSLKADPSYVDAHLAIAELALDKTDYREAVKSLELAVKLRADDPQIHFLLAKAWLSSDPERASQALQTALELNPRHADSLLMQAENRIDAEDYAAAEQLIDEVLLVNANDPLGWSLKGAVAHLRGLYRLEGECREHALSTWTTNPAVDYTIGKLLSQHYRFDEAIQYQRRALRLSPQYLPAKFQLAQDLLRGGRAAEGWELLDEVVAADQYNVVAFNLSALKTRLLQFTTLEADGLIVRMDAREARIYGQRVMQLLTQASHVLSAKYKHELSLPITVEIFPQQSDFAIRTFGLPGGAGFLGVCFGSLITANSPASQGAAPANWESVLWHEFCHVVTLQKTQNRMPRWLSEGISVYEELQRDPSWGQSLTPAYKEMLLGDDFVPLSQLSGAFLKPESPLHLQFAYFESSLAVRYLIDVHGLPLLRQLLVDLGAGLPQGEAFAQRYGDVAALDADFQRFVTELATAFLPETDFDREGLPDNATSEELNSWIETHPGSYFAQRQWIERLIESQQWPAARDAIERLLELYPNDATPGGGLEKLALVARQMGDATLEQETLQRHVLLTSDNLPALLRLTELTQSRQDWSQLLQHSQQILAVQPLLPTGHEALALAARQLSQPAEAADALGALLEMEPHDPAQLRYERAQLLRECGRLKEARQQILMALEETPRYRSALQLLSRIHNELQPTAGATGVTRPDAGQPPRPK